MLCNCKVSCTQNPALTRYQITESHRHRYRRRWTPHLKFVIDAEETRTPLTVADSRSRHVIIVKKGAIIQEFVARNNRVSQSNHPKHRRTLKSTLLKYSESDEFENVLGSIKIHNESKPSSNVILVDLKAEGKPLKMELDTGSAVSII